MWMLLIEYTYYSKNAKSDMFILLQFECLTKIIVYRTYIDFRKHVSIVVYEYVKHDCIDVIMFYMY